MIKIMLTLLLSTTCINTHMWLVHRTHTDRVTFISIHSHLFTKDSKAKQSRIQQP